MFSHGLFLIMTPNMLNHVHDIYIRTWKHNTVMCHTTCFGLYCQSYTSNTTRLTLFIIMDTYLKGHIQKGVHNIV